MTSTQEIVEPLLHSAIRARASDIHIEPMENKFVVRLRVDGQLKAHKQYSWEQLSKVTTKLKVMAGMDITDRRLPQDGRFSLDLKGAKYDFRVSTSPMITGEKIVIRVLHKNLSELDFDYLGYSPGNLSRYQGVLSRPYGLVLHCGPTGSGKTTSLYTAINHLNNNDRNIQTIEDPVEGRLPGINQAQVNPDIGLTFAALLRSYLRQDCDVILVGEIRDPETAQLAVQAALTGHMILGTLHASTAVGAMTRLTEMEISPFFVGSAVTGVVNQRLVRRLCMACREPYSPAEKVRKRLRLPASQRLYRPSGCAACGGSGFKGRICIQEILEITDAIKSAYHDGHSEAALSKLARQQGMVPMLSDGIAKALTGSTTIEEVTLSVKGIGMSADDLVQAEADRGRDTRESRPSSRESLSRTATPKRSKAPRAGTTGELSSRSSLSQSSDNHPPHQTSPGRGEQVVEGVLISEGEHSSGPGAPSGGRSGPGESGRPRYRQPGK